MKHFRIFMIFSGNKHKSHQTIMKLLNGKHVNKEFTAQKFEKQAFSRSNKKQKKRLAIFGRIDIFISRILLSVFVSTFWIVISFFFKLEISRIIDFLLPISRRLHTDDKTSKIFHFFDELTDYFISNLKIFKGSLKL